jgi:hypothetical protein
VTLAIALPREGGVYWPNNFDERTKYAGRLVWSVRVISRSVGPRASSEGSADYLFELRGGSEWVFLERRGLLIVD